ncbi:MAG TPA: nucleoside triphosphate pyrophosphohydrolase [Actinobacteria bacterium]|nr:nucleoside triphosphate pyrophosphohydrolase [Actinomycetota bacterium]
MDFDLNSPDPELLDRIKLPDELFKILLDIMKRLRSDGGCLWDREQDHGSLKKSLIEEAYETVEAIESGNPENLNEELGDLLLQVVFHGQIANEKGSFNTSSIIRTLIKKLLRRHPHVFGDNRAGSNKEILATWEDIKREERKNGKKNKDSIFSGIPKSLPPLHYAYEIQNRASRLGFDWDGPSDVYEKIIEELKELKEEVDRNNKEAASAELGDLLFSIVNYGRHLKIDIEKSLKDTGGRFIERFKLMEKLAEEKGLEFSSLPLEEKDRLWEIAKKRYYHEKDKNNMYNRSDQ